MADFHKDTPKPNSDLSSWPILAIIRGMTEHQLHVLGCYLTGGSADPDLILKHAQRLKAGGFGQENVIQDLRPKADSGGRLTVTFTELWK